MAALSREDRALIAYIGASGVPHRVTTTTNHSQLTNAGYKSRHVMVGTDGMGLAIDVAGPTAGRDTSALRAIFDAFLRVEHELHELIYAGAPFNIKNGRRVAPYAVRDHHDHVHVSVDRGVFVAWPAPQPEEDDVTPADIDAIANKVVEKLAPVLATGNDGNSKPRGPVGGVVARLDERIGHQGLDLGWIKDSVQKVAEKVGATLRPQP